MDATNDAAVEAPPVSPCAEVALPGASSRRGGGWHWSQAQLERAARQLPVARLFPELLNEMLAVLPRWAERFEPAVWARMLKVGDGAAFKAPRLLKELNEVAPIIAALRRWLREEGAAFEAPCTIVDLCSGFGFLAMFLSELVDKELVERIVLVDRGFANAGVDAGGRITSDHVYASGEWRVPLLTIKSHLKRGTHLRALRDRLLEDSWGPVAVLGMHLCNTLSLRAAQLFNASPRVRFFALAPCCLPAKAHREKKIVYEVGGHRFSAAEVHSADPAANFSAWVGHILAGLTGDPAGKAVERHDVHDAGPKYERHKGAGLTYAQNAFIFARRSTAEAAEVEGRLAGAPAADGGFGPVVIEASYLAAERRPVGYPLPLEPQGELPSYDPTGAAVVA